MYMDNNYFQRRDNINAEPIQLGLVSTSYTIKKNSKHSIFSNLYSAANIIITVPQSLYNMCKHLFELRSSGKLHYIIKIGLHYFLNTKYLEFNILFLTTTAPTMNFLIRKCKF